MVAISLTLAATIGGYLASALATFSLALTILGITFAVTGTFLLGLTVRSAFNGSLHKMSQAYHEKAEAAQKYIQEIQTAKKNKLDIRINIK
ncbi:MAG: hypothetical protein HWD61_02750 [Parachlamydiaceae bacterium]|nr:MAG: hypothetical protein HWD61_02750 [Parachlamydiaceae bacterium]